MLTQEICIRCIRLDQKAMPAERAERRRRRQEERVLSPDFDIERPLNMLQRMPHPNVFVVL